MLQAYGVAIFLAMSGAFISWAMFIDSTLIFLDWPGAKHKQFKRETKTKLMLSAAYFS